MTREQAIKYLEQYINDAAGAIGEYGGMLDEDTIKAIRQTSRACRMGIAALHREHEEAKNFARSVGVERIGRRLAMDAMDKLKPCPWCGSEDVVMEREFVTSTYAVRCRGCTAYVWQYYAIRDEAVEAWNKRKPAEWVPVYDSPGGRQSGWQCSRCTNVNNDLSNGNSNYCPDCGAEME